MHKKIVWSPLADNDLGHILDFLNKNWNSRVVIGFLNRIENASSQISKSPHQFPLINKELNVRKCVLTKQNTLYYRVTTKQIEILRLYDSRQDPQRLIFLG
jgi:plasmid stabilization system protein ParE